ncbi:MAG TPA: cell division protein ZapE [Rhizomicrobium sp.]|nr:cell division protein ZapE [Rhizomicrobium sp.]
MADRILKRYRVLVASGELAPDAAQASAAERLQDLAATLSAGRLRKLFSRRSKPKGLYLWGDVGRGKSMLMDLFFDGVSMPRKLRVHFNAFMADVHAQIHEQRKRGVSDPIVPVARSIAETARLLCFDEFQVSDVADAMILGRLFEQLFALGVVVVATSNTSPRRLYEGGLNRQLFLPFIAMIEQQLDVLELDGDRDYRLQRLSEIDTYITPLGPAADAAMDRAWLRLTDQPHGVPQTLIVLGRKLRVPQAAKGVARFSFAGLCTEPRAAVDYLEIARHFHTLLIDNTPQMGPERRDEARRFTVLIDTLYDQSVKLICSAEVPPDRLYIEGDGLDAFRRTASRLAEMQSADYLKRGHAVGGARAAEAEDGELAPAPA